MLHFKNVRRKRQVAIILSNLTVLPCLRTRRACAPVGVAWIHGFSLFSPTFFFIHLKPSMCIDVSTVYPVLYMLAVSLSGSADVLAAFVVIIMLFFFFFFFCNTWVLSFCSNPTQNGRTKKKNGKERGKK